MSDFHRLSATDESTTSQLIAQHTSESSERLAINTRRLPRVGVLVPSTDTTLEQELPQILNGIASVHVTRMALGAVDEAGLRTMEGDALRAAELLADISPDVVLFGCTSGTFVLGAKHEHTFATLLAEITGAAVVTTAWALLQSLPAHGQRIRLRTPYTDDLTSAEARYLTAAGFTVVSAAGLGITKDREIAEVDAEAVFDLARHVPLADSGRLDNVYPTTGEDDAEVILLSCTNLPTLDLLKGVQSATDLPVLSSNLAAGTAIRRVLAGDLEPLAPPKQPKERRQA